ncbi:hypothetical protein L0664_18135 [Octadecabacter sp. G9-8]|uniref:Sulfotransferase family protein n=1 Tax=Octadecabacter dasysiphoniae TaxID=2909341 RepID=A0ABS9D0I9_9RHOB|nr:hypothetical protein [Octadecabacter dasysiphoniae]
MPQSIALHIGAHKTASSHLQNVLYKNRGLLADDGIRIYGPRYLRMPGRNLAAMFGLSWSESPPPRRTPKRQLKFLVKGRRHLVLSEENFVGNLADLKGRTVLPIYPTGRDRIAELVAKWAPVETDLFVAVRDPASFLGSAYSQAMFGGFHIRPRQFRLRNDWRAVDWADYIDGLRTIDGLRRIYVWRQEDYHQSQSLIVKHLTRISDVEPLKFIDKRVHQGLSVTAVQTTLEASSAGEKGTLARDARRAFPVGKDHSLFELYSSSTLRKSRDIYAAQMARIAQMDGVTVLQSPPTGDATQPQG